MSNFFDCLSQSTSEKVDMRIKNILYNYFGKKINILQNIQEENDKGIDYFVYDNKNKEPLYIDIKVRSIPITKYNDIALETISNIEEKKIGNILDDSKLTDYILFLYTDNYLIYKFKELKKVFKNNLELWKTKYFRAKQFTQVGTSGYHSECIFVPITVVENALFWDELD